MHGGSYEGESFERYPRALCARPPGEWGGEAAGRRGGGAAGAWRGGPGGAGV